MNDKLSLKSLAKMIDHSLLHPTFTDQEILKGCELAIQYDVAAACVKPYCVPEVFSILKGTDVAVCAVIAFPHGNSSTDIKVLEAEKAASAGASEIDMVVNTGKVLGLDWDYVFNEIDLINKAVTKQQVVLKVIFENDFLLDEHIIKLCEICAQCKVAYVKTSTGYGFVKQPDGMYSYKGATDHHLSLMRKNSPQGVAIKAAGGIRTLDDLLRVRSLGVTRIGATATEQILEEAKKRGYQ